MGCLFFTGNSLECFDSFGGNPARYSPYLKERINGDYQIIQSEVLQSNDTTVCGQYCTFLIPLKAYNYFDKDILSAFRENKIYSDLSVCRFINKFFKLRTAVKDKKMLISQLLKE